jgi:ferric-chelate reductase (NADPH)
MPQSKPDNGLSGAVFRLISKNATVRVIREVGEAFRWITLEGEALRGVSWRPGGKVQIHVGGWAQRTYTPLAWDATGGSMQFLAFIHGEGPGARRMRVLSPGDACTVFGPRGSIDLSALERPTLIFGDETSLGLAHALRHTPRGADGAVIVLEVSSRAATEPVLAALELGDVTLVERRPDDAHLPEVAQVIADRIRERSLSTVALSGKASSIQAVNKAVRAVGLKSAQIHTKAYWAVGKAGLD